MMCSKQRWVLVKVACVWEKFSFSVTALTLCWGVHPGSRSSSMFPVSAKGQIAQCPPRSPAPAPYDERVTKQSGSCHHHHMCSNIQQHGMRESVAWCKEENKNCTGWRRKAERTRHTALRVTGADYAASGRSFSPRTFAQYFWRLQSAVFLSGSLSVSGRTFSCPAIRLGGWFCCVSLPFFFFLMT